MLNAEVLGAPCMLVPLPQISDVTLQVRVSKIGGIEV